MNGGPTSHSNSSTNKDRAAKLRDPQVAVVGGGPAGATAAIVLARAGVRTYLFEKSTGPHHKVCGEFLSGEGVEDLRELGVDFRRLDARPIRGFRLHGPHRTCEARLPVAALGVSRYHLDEELLRLAAEAGVIVERGVHVREMREGLEGVHGGLVLDTSAGERIADRLIVATGKNEFRSVQTREGRDESLVGFKMHLRLKPSVARMMNENIDLFVFEGGYGGLSPIENGLFNFCFLIDRQLLPKIGADWNRLAYHISKHNLQASIYLDGAEPQFRQFVTCAGVPYGFVRRARPDPGVFCVGDQMAVIASLAGDGMSIATKTGRRAAACILDPTAPGRLQPATSSVSYQRSLQSRLQWQVDASYAVHTLFKNPRACDWATYFVKTFPKIIDLLFKQTRFQGEQLSLAKSGG